MRVDGKIVVITGATRGIGRQMAFDFGQAGARGVVICGRTADKLKAVAAELEAAGTPTLAVTADVAQFADCKRIMDETMARFGAIDILINNAGISGPNAYARDIEPEDWLPVIATNLSGTFACCHYALGPMMAQESGVILNVSAMVTKKPSPRRAPYAASKSGLVGLTRTLAMELASFGIRVNNISPGPIEGERVEEVIGRLSRSFGKTHEEAREQLLNYSPMHKMVTADDVSKLALFLASDHGKHMTGQDINVTAGIVMW